MKLKLYYRLDCHLCEDMYQLIQPYLSEYDIELEMLNIDKHKVLQDRYTSLIPVLTDHLDNEICHYFFDKVSFEKFLSNKIG
ncbi:MAG: glutaredoxin family protein [gamma proteobacterium symbiont of Taylorina sp.]|nr:glutaredoxin family protein [gamma proteobacterium symbiont of Taylorina sp.]